MMRTSRWFDRIVSSPERFRRATPHSPLPHHASSTPAKAVLRVYRVPGGGWCVGRDGAAPEAAFKNRIPAIEFARLLGMAAGSYQIVFETSDGDVLEERYVSK